MKMDSCVSFSTDVCILLLVEPTAKVCQRMGWQAMAMKSFQKQYLHVYVCIALNFPSYTAELGQMMEWWLLARAFATELWKVFKTIIYQGFAEPPTALPVSAAAGCGGPANTQWLVRSLPPSPDVRPPANSGAGGSWGWARRWRPVLPLLTTLVLRPVVHAGLACNVQSYARPVALNRLAACSCVLLRRAERAEHGCQGNKDRRMPSENPPQKNFGLDFSARKAWVRPEWKAKPEKHCERNGWKWSQVVGLQSCCLFPTIGKM